MHRSIITIFLFICTGFVGETDEKVNFGGKEAAQSYHGEDKRAGVESGEEFGYRVVKGKTRRRKVRVSKGKGGGLSIEF